jgi:ABC-2 type transport system permease protein
MIDRSSEVASKHVGVKRSKGFWKRVMSLTRKEFRQLLRDKSNLAVGIVLPMVLILIFGYGLSLDVTDAPIAVVLEDPSPIAAEVVSGLELSTYLSPVVVSSMQDGRRLMLARRVDGILRIPNDFSRRLAAGDAQVQLLVHGTEASRAIIIRAYVNGAIRQWTQRTADREGVVGKPKAGSVTLVERMWFNSANNSTWYIVPGVIVLIMTLVGAFLTSMVMAREWERGTLEALFVSPVRPTEILLAKIIPYFLVGMVGLGMCLLAARLLFQVPMFGSFLILLGCSMIYMLVALGLGLVISSVMKNQFLASQVALLTSFMPALMLSGFLFDLRNVPTAIYMIGQLLPATYFMELIRTLFLAGNVWPLIFKNTAILVGYAILLLGLARFVTRKKLD